jgi:preprotein translocase subunit SecD
MSGQSILLELDDEGARLFAQITGDHVGRQLAIVLDGVLITAPIIRAPITGGRAEITGHFTPEETLEIALALETSLDLRLRVIEEKKF